MGVDEFVGSCVAIEHVAKERESVKVIIGTRSIGSYDGCEEVNVRGMKMIKDETSIGEI